MGKYGNNSVKKYKHMIYLSCEKVENIRNTSISTYEIYHEIKK